MPKLRPPKLSFRLSIDSLLPQQDLGMLNYRNTLAD